MDWIISIVGGLISTFIAIAFVIWMENARKPKLSLKIAAHEDATWTDRTAKKGRWLRLMVKIKPLPRLVKWLSRNPAFHCSGLITFHHLDGQNVSGRSMQARWVSPREPLPITIVAEGLPRMQILDPVRLAPELHKDIYSGESERLDVAGRFDEDDECYGWCDENYSSEPLWRNPDWKLNHERYLVKVTIFCSGESHKDVFRLINDVPVKDFRLESAQPDDYEKVGLNNKL